MISFLSSVSTSPLVSTDQLLDEAQTCYREARNFNFKRRKANKIIHQLILKNEHNFETLIKAGHLANDHHSFDTAMKCYETALPKLEQMPCDAALRKSRAFLCAARKFSLYSMNTKVGFILKECFVPLGKKMKREKYFLYDYEEYSLFLRSAYLAVKAKEWDSASQIFQTLEPYIFMGNKTDELHKYGDSLMRARHYPQAIEILQKAHEKSPENLMICMDLAYCHQNLMHRNAIGKGWDSYNLKNQVFNKNKVWALNYWLKIQNHPEAKEELKILAEKRITSLENWKFSSPKQGSGQTCCPSLCFE